MAFGPEIIVDRTKRRPPIRMAALSLDDLRDFPPIPPAGAKGEVSEYVTQEFIDEAETLQVDHPRYPEYYEQLRDDPRALWWGIHVGGRAVGFAGWRDEEGDAASSVMSAKSRLVIMDKRYMGQGIGYAAGLGRFWYATQRRGINHLTANVDLNNTASYKISRALGSACIQDKVMPEDPTRHQMRLWYPTRQRPIDFQQLPPPLHGDSWKDATRRLNEAFKTAAKRVHITGDR